MNVDLLVGRTVRVKLKSGWVMTDKLLHVEKKKDDRYGGYPLTGIHLRGAGYISAAKIDKIEQHKPTIDLPMENKEEQKDMSQFQIEKNISPFQIEKGVPVADSYRTIWPFSKMEVGDSFVCINAKQANAACQFAYSKGMKARQRKIKGTAKYRIWRMS